VVLGRVVAVVDGVSTVVVGQLVGEVWSGSAASVVWQLAEMMQASPTSTA
jgi:hypothetical protein